MTEYNPTGIKKELGISYLGGCNSPKLIKIYCRNVFIWRHSILAAITYALNPVTVASTACTVQVETKLSC